MDGCLGSADSPIIGPLFRPTGGRPLGHLGGGTRPQRGMIFSSGPIEVRTC